MIRAAAARDLPRVRALFVEYARSLSFPLDFQGFDDELAALPGAYAPPRGTILLVERDGDAIGIGALRPHDAANGEIKRMYLRPDARGMGLGRRLLLALVDAARVAGCERVRLDSHAATMQPAIALYRSIGFREVPADGPDLDGAIVFFELPLR